MTLPTSGTISLNDLLGEFGGSTPISLGDCYRGGARVPNTAGNAGIPTSGAIQLDDFYGASGVNLPASVSRMVNAPSPASATASVTVNRNGSISVGASTLLWHVNGDSTIGDSYEVRLDLSSGSLDSGSSGAWLSLSTARAFSITQSSVGSKSASGTLRIRRADTAVEQDTAPLSLSATVEV